MEVPSVLKLDSLKYSELQQLAKQAGLKANLKADRLLKSLKEHFHPAVLPDQISEENNNEKDGESTRPDFARGQRKRQRTKDVISKKTTLRQAGNPSPAAKIQGHSDRLSKSGSKSLTPNFKKLHEAHFKKMESIDKYMERKKTRLDAVSNSIHEAKMMAMESKLVTAAKKTPISSSKKRLQSKFFVLSPGPLKGLGSPAPTPTCRRQSARFGTASKSILANKSALKPFSLSVTKMNVRFSETTKDNEHKRSLIKTPARKSSCFETPEKKARISFPLQAIELVADANKSLLLCESDIKCEFSKITPHQNQSDDNNVNQPVTTPFKFTAQPTTPSTNKKQKFDIQASLARPLGYQPHKGKLKPWRQDKENNTGTRSTASAMRDSFKQPILPTRDCRRKRHEEDRKLKRDNTVGTRRGVVMQ
ncbi:nucleolar and spindle-associated protein 1 [Rana temporaria]|uniref:nucleolar and spindle-associated protein 1 n=1 Tax=Rana temporaria TaxID=8407 RepID=UPI001AACAFD4|nr:nucleolar and spindle-associated protein 1 [Rana temporaria]